MQVILGALASHVSRIKISQTGRERQPDVCVPARPRAFLCFD
jgi:hypothetical protein